MEKSTLLIVNLQAMAKRRRIAWRVLIEASKLENDLPKLGSVFTELYIHRAIAFESYIVPYKLVSY